MLHPSYTDLMNIVNGDVEEGGRTGYQQPLLYRYGNSQESKTDHWW